MADPNSDLASKVCRAIRALLISEGAGSTVDTYAAPANDDRTLPNTTITAGDGNPFDGPGNWQFSVNINLRDEAVAQPTESDPAVKRVTANERLTRIVNALTRSDDTHTLDYTRVQLNEKGRALAVDESGGTDAAITQRATDNADMADFTVLWWEAAGVGSASKSGGDGATFWERDLQFNCMACNANLDG